MSRVPFPIHHTFGPLVTRKQWHLAFRLQFQPWKWREGGEREALRRELSRAFGCSAALFGSGRDALRAALQALELQPGEEVIMQGFTCIAVPNAIHAAQGTPVYSDIDRETLNLDPEKIQRAITPRTRAVICQHTFGIPADTKRLRAICDRRHLALIEDCAHIIPDAGEGKQLSLLRTASAGGGIGLHGDLLIFSFGRDKAISGVTGGAALTRHPAMARRLERMEQEASPFSLWHILNVLGYPLRYRFAKGIWNLPFGEVSANLAKAYLHGVRSCGLLPPVFTAEEKEGRLGIALHSLPNACAALILEQLQSLGSLNDHRRKLAQFYIKASEERGWRVPAGVRSAPALLKFPLFVADADGVRKKLKAEQVYLDDGWCGAVVNPRSVRQEVAGYAPGSCPVAEDLAAHLLALPTHPTMNDAQARYLVHALRSVLTT